MAFERGISDNPFRTTDLPSLVTYAELRRRADALSKAGAVGMGAPPPLSDAFDSEPSELGSQVRALRTDPAKWLTCALYWPISQFALDFALGRLPAYRATDNNRSQAEAPSLSSIKLPTSLRDPLPSQAMFMRSWLKFLDQGDELTLRTSLDYWARFTADSSFRQEVSAHVASETAFDPAQVEVLLNKVITNETKAVLARATSVALRLWRAGERSSCLKLMDTVLASPLDDHLEAIALTPFIDIGDALCEDVNRVDVCMTYDPELKEVVLPWAARGLYALVSSIGARHPRTSYWMERFEGFVGYHAEEIREEALEYASNREYGEALDRLQALLAVNLLPLEPEEQIRSEIDHVQALQRQPHVTSGEKQATSNATQENPTNSTVSRTSAFPWPMATLILLTLIALASSLTESPRFTLAPHSNQTKPGPRSSSLSLGDKAPSAPESPQERRTRLEGLRESLKQKIEQDEQSLPADRQNLSASAYAAKLKEYRRRVARYIEVMTALGEGQ